MARIRTITISGSTPYAERVTSLASKPRPWNCSTHVRSSLRTEDVKHQGTQPTPETVRKTRHHPVLRIPPHGYPLQLIAHAGAAAMRQLQASTLSKRIADTS